MRRGPPAAGFTLLELLVAMTVMGLLTALLFGGLQFGARVWRLGDSELDRFQQVDAAFELMRRTLLAASPKLVTEDADLPPRRLRTPADRPVPKVDFDGEPDGITFVGPAPAAVIGGGLYRLTFAVGEKEGQRQLMFAFQPAADDADADAASAKTEILLEGIDRARFAYYGKEGDARDATWYDTWRDQEKLPELVSVQIEFAADDRRVWPQLLVAPLLSSPLQ